MYNNWFTGLFMSEQGVGDYLTVVKYYDVFSFRGFFNWWVDAICAVFASWWLWILIYIRTDSNDWTYGTTEKENNIDMNRLFVISNNIDPYDFSYWSTRSNGKDCNGNLGKGYYCYCPSQGYSCSCKYDSIYKQGELKNMCYDHYGFDCLGNYVDGEGMWC